MSADKREFTVEGEYPYDRSGPLRWILSHAMRYPHLPLSALALATLSSIAGSQAPLYLGRVFDYALSPQKSSRRLLALSLAVLGLWVGQVSFDVLCRVLTEFLSRRIQRDAREELYVHLLGKSLTYHGRQRVGDLMSRATGDVRWLNYMFSPGLRVIAGSLISLLTLVIAAGTIERQLLAVPLIAVATLAWAVRRYVRQVSPAAAAQFRQSGLLSASLTEALSGIEVVKADAQESYERQRLLSEATDLRRAYVRWGEVRARDLPQLAFQPLAAAGFFHALYLLTRGAISLGDTVAFVSLMGALGANAARWRSVSGLLASGRAGAVRILELINAPTELDEVRSGVDKPMRGEVVFEEVSFAYDGKPVLRGITFHIQPGMTVAIVGQTGSGKTTLTRLISRVCDVTGGRLLIDGVDVRCWNLDALRSQISTVEQDVFLFSRTIAENIAFGAGPGISRAEIERCAREAQAHEFITRFERGYDTLVGERGVTLSGGQRQRIAIARALLTSPRILILDDSTSAIDSATEDQIQAAIDVAKKGRTTFLITHRLSQIRWADRILVLRRGELVDQGTHDELIRRCAPYRRIFARYEAAEPPLDARGTAADKSVPPASVP